MTNKIKMAWMKTTPYGMWSKEFNAAELADLLTTITGTNEGGRISIRSVKDINKSDGSEFESHVLEFIPSSSLKKSQANKANNTRPNTNRQTQQYADQDF